MNDDLPVRIFNINRAEFPALNIAQIKKDIENSAMFHIGSMTCIQFWDSRDDPAFGVLTKHYYHRWMIYKNNHGVYAERLGQYKLVGTRTAER